jgi:xanthine dehydrogenase YagR molybdenum-binding subunit
MSVAERVLGAPVDRIEGGDKVQGQAKYAYEYELENVAYASLVVSPVVKGTIRTIDAANALAIPGVLAVLTHESAPELAEQDGELGVLQSPRIAYRGQIVGAAIAESLETAREAARLVRLEIDEEEHDVVLRSDHQGLYKPDHINPANVTDTEEGDVDAALRSAAVTIDVTYTTPAEHNNPMEPHATTAIWEGDGLTLYDSDQGPYAYREVVAKRLGLEPEKVRVIATHVGGGFGSKGLPRPT